MKKWFIKLINKNKCTCWFDSFKIKIFEWFKEWTWGECCGAHDIAYIYHTDEDSKLEVDNDLFRCIRKKTCWLWAAIMYAGNFTFSWYAWYFVYNKKER